MDAQAQTLRRRMESAGAVHTAAEAVVEPRLAQTLAIASGKGGVGKSTLALGIAMAAAQRGVRTALIDADLGLANLDLLCGVQPARTGADWLAGRAELAQCFLRIAPRLWLLPGASGVARLADLEPAHRMRLIAGLARVGSLVDWMIVDLGAGLGAGTVEIAAASDRLLIVTTPEPTSMADAYGFVKACAQRGTRAQVHAAITMAESGDDAAAVAARLTATAVRHLGLRIALAGVVPVDPSVPAAVRARVPLLAFAPSSAAARAVRALEGRIAAESDAAVSPSLGELAPPSVSEPVVAAPRNPGLVHRLLARWGRPGSALPGANHHPLGVVLGRTTAVQ